MSEPTQSERKQTSKKHVVVFDGDDASPEVMIPSVNLLESMQLPIQFERPLIGEAAQNQTGQAFPDETKAAIDAADCTFFGSTSGASTAALFYLRWGKQTYANVRPCEWWPGYKTPLPNHSRCQLQCHLTASSGFQNVQSSDDRPGRLNQLWWP